VTEHKHADRREESDEQPLPAFTVERARDRSPTTEELRHQPDTGSAIDKDQDIAAEPGAPDDLGSTGLEPIFDPTALVVRPPRDGERR
jgi:hypothetical protein